MDHVVIRAYCPWCGTVELLASELSWGAEPQGKLALCESPALTALA